MVQAGPYRKSGGVFTELHLDIAALGVSMVFPAAPAVTEQLSHFLRFRFENAVGHQAATLRPNAHAGFVG
jgi:hypothetical protein